MSLRTRRDRRRNAQQPTEDALITVKLSDLQAAALMDYYRIAIAAELVEQERLLKDRARLAKEHEALQSHLDDLNGASHG